MTTTSPGEEPAALHTTRFRIPLLWRILATNALVITAAVAAIAFTPAKIPEPDTLTSAVVVVAGLAVVLVANLFLLRRALGPLQRLTELMGRVDPLNPGERIPAGRADAEVIELSEAFNAMLERLEAERREATSRTVAAQEAERGRIARELHDEIGQRLTAMLLQLSHAASKTSPGAQEVLAEVSETVRQTLGEVRTISAQLRPVALDDLGLMSALGVLAEQMSEPGGPLVEASLAPHLPSLGEDAELVIYRVAQEALTNAVRHADASRIALILEGDSGQVRLLVRDDGRGLDGAMAGNGIRGMQERALLVGAKLDIVSRDAAGTQVQLAVPLR